MLGEECFGEFDEFFDVALEVLELLVVGVVFERRFN